MKRVQFHVSAGKSLGSEVMALLTNWFFEAERKDIIRNFQIKFYPTVTCEVRVMWRKSLSEVLFSLLDFAEANKIEILNRSQKTRNILLSESEVCFRKDDGRLTLRVLSMTKS